ncbi:O-antigen ligase family protein [Catellatospora paridis]|uniref:O-antigen ligase family protein n=1 Tax=Catellatospora paridis TaxID=1617086 RepID=UPI0012D454FD|nr:O-antigen ligase family protein [Catellatospora paridis]
MTATVRPSEHRRATVISNGMFVTGLAIIAILMPLGHLPNPPESPPYVSMVLLPLLLQRMVIMAWDGYHQREGGWPSARVAVAFALPVVAAIAATVTAFNANIAWAAAILLFSGLLRGWVLAQYVREREVKLFEDFVLWMTVVVTGFGLFQFFGDTFGVPTIWTLLDARYTSAAAFPFPRVQSFALEPLYLAHYLFLPIGILLVRRWRTRRATTFEQVLLIATLTVLLLTLSRGGILGLLLCVLAMTAVTRSWRELLYFARSVVVAFVIVVGLLSLAGAMPNAYAPDNKKANAMEAFTSHAVDLSEDSARTRYDLWPGTVQIFLDQPLLGVGPNNSRLLLQDGTPTTTPDEAVVMQPVNNDYLAYLSEMGLVGIILTLPLIWLVLRSLWGVVRARFDHPSGPYAFALVGMAFQANSFHSLLMLGTWVVIGLLIAGARLVGEKQAEASDTLETTRSPLGAAVA